MKKLFLILSILILAGSSLPSLGLAITSQDLAEVPEDQARAVFTAFAPVQAYYLLTADGKVVIMKASQSTKNMPQGYFMPLYLDPSAAIKQKNETQSKEKKGYQIKQIMLNQILQAQYEARKNPPSADQNHPDFIVVTSELGEPDTLLYFPTDKTSGKPVEQDFKEHRYVQVFLGKEQADQRSDFLSKSKPVETQSVSFAEGLKRILDYSSHDVRVMVFGIPWNQNTEPVNVPIKIDRVHLKNGLALEGKIIQEKKELLTFSLPGAGAPVSIPMDSISFMEKDVEIQQSSPLRPDEILQLAATPWFDFQFDSRKWKTGSQKTTSGQIVTEYFLENEAPGTWTEKITVEAIIPSQDGVSGLGTLVKNNEVEIKSHCPKTDWKIIFQNETEILYQWSAQNCKDLPDQTEIAKAVGSRGSLHRLSYTRTISTLPEADQKAWLERIRAARLVTPLQTALPPKEAKKKEAPAAPSA